MILELEDFETIFFEPEDYRFSPKVFEEVVDTIYLDDSGTFPFLLVGTDDLAFDDSPGTDISPFKVSDSDTLSFFEESNFLNVVNRDEDSFDLVETFSVKFPARFLDDETIILIEDDVYHGLIRFGVRQLNDSESIVLDESYGFNIPGIYIADSEIFRFIEDYVVQIVVGD